MLENEIVTQTIELINHTDTVQAMMDDHDRDPVR